jgi:CubicO group peptidase (beta-lactamase class C family)
LLISLIVVTSQPPTSTDHGAKEPLKTETTAPRLAQQEDVASSLRLLEAWIESHIAYRNLPGLAIGIVHDQDLIWAKGFGYANVEAKIPATPGTIYRIASISKVFTTTAIMQLRDQGKLALDDPVEKYLPWFKLKNAAADASVITIRQLVTHTAGLPREAPFPYWTDLQFPTRDQVREALSKQEAVYSPGTRWKYSNLGLAVAGEIVEAVSGEPFAEYISKHIFAPLDMKSSAVGVPESLRKRLAVGYGRRMPDGKRELRPFTDARGINPAAGLSSCVEDLARLASLQFRDGPAEGKQILKGATLKEMHRVQWLLPDWKGGRGLGWQIVHREDGDLVGHGGWVAGYQTAVFFRPRDKIAVIALTNADDGQPYPGTPESVVDRAFKWVGAAIRKATTPVKPEKANPEWQKYVGLYRSPWADSQVLIMNGKLTMINPTEQEPTGSLATLVPVGEHRFRMEDGLSAGPHGEQVFFEIGKDGKVVRVKIGENYSYPPR